MKNYQHEFIEYVLYKNILKFGAFTLKSGRVSPYFFNAGLFNTGRDLAFLGRMYATALIESGVDFDLLFGLAYKGIPIAAITAVALTEHFEKNIPYCFNRKIAKEHGEGGCLVGSPLEGKIMLIDDVITAGTTVREPMATIVSSHQATLAGIIISLDRQEKGSRDISAVDEIKLDYQCQVISVVSITDLIDYLTDKKDMHKQLLAIHAYRQRYGV